MWFLSVEPKLTTGQGPAGVIGETNVVPQCGTNIEDGARARKGHWGKGQKGSLWLVALYTYLKSLTV